ncbi:hypothetical protein [Luteolibacter sp. AS25]|uniref:hypothetical protein n=1 Tax=Luteolibacter sp. AS25 TaxID=3135776 RepID=UPI00398AB1A9
MKKLTTLLGVSISILALSSCGAMMKGKKSATEGGDTQMERSLPDTEGEGM